MTSDLASLSARLESGMTLDEILIQEAALTGDKKLDDLTARNNEDAMEIRTRVAVARLYVKGWTPQEIADELGMSRSDIWSTIKSYFGI